MTTGRIRHAEPCDADALTAIETAADTRFESVFGPLEWEAEVGELRLADDGFVLVAESGAALIGFVHVLEVDDIAHLDQLSVLPTHGGRGVGRALVEAACLQATALGYPRITLRTFADVAWNAPFYARCGFAVIEDAPTPFHAALPAAEHALGLDALGARVLMSRTL